MTTRPSDLNLIRRNVDVTSVKRRDITIRTCIPPLPTHVILYLAFSGDSRHPQWRAIPADDVERELGGIAREYSGWTLSYGVELPPEGRVVTIVALSQESPDAK